MYPQKHININHRFSYNPSQYIWKRTPLRFLISSNRRGKSTAWFPLLHISYLGSPRKKYLTSWLGTLLKKKCTPSLQICTSSILSQSILTPMLKRQENLFHDCKLFTWHLGGKFKSRSFRFTEFFADFVSSTMFNCAFSSLHGYHRDWLGMFSHDFLEFSKSIRISKLCLILRLPQGCTDSRTKLILIYFSYIKL